MSSPELVDSMNAPGDLPITCHAVWDGSHSGLRNMVTDGVLLDAAVQNQFCSLRFYEWSQPTISLGHFQPDNDPVVQQRFPNLAQVRRLSGGGAILHDRELTYSCSLPAAHPLVRNPGQVYDIVHQGIIEVLARHGVDCRMRGAALSGPEPFLCFGRGDPRDIVIGNNKIVGSAQRRRSGAVLQHGSILLSTSPHAPEFPGIQELTGVSLNCEQLMSPLLERIGRDLGTIATLSQWPDDILQRIEQRMVP
ncbi:MAG: hypothetical protein KDA90_14925 [Planctomycetaceae bacterium]|nr:hypothetical protein [Planctomycetaceae bacterium]